MIWCWRLLWWVLAAMVVALTVTSIPSFSGDSLLGRPLMAHMAASGVLVFLLPILAVTGLTVGLGRGWPLGIGFWATLTTGLITTGTIFVCMWPLPSTDQMHTLLLWHTASGLAMVVAVILGVAASLRRGR